MPDSTLIRDTFAPLAEKRLSQAPIRNKMRNAIGAYIDRNSDILYTLNMSDRYSFSAKDKDVIYEAIGTTEDEVAAVAAKSPDVYDANKIKSNPFYIACMVTLSVLLKLNLEDDAKLVATYVSLPMYVSAHSGSWPSKPNKNIMNYTLANLDRGFRITQVKSIYEFIMDNAVTALETYAPWLYTPPNKPKPTAERKVSKSSSKKVMVTIEPCSDYEICNIIDQFWSRLKQKIIKIAQEFYKNKASGKYLNYDSESTNPNDFRIMDNDSFALDRIASTVYSKLINHQFKAQWLKLAVTQSNQSTVSYTKLVNLFDDIIQEDDNEELRKLILSILEYFVLVAGNPIDKIPTPRFISVVLAGFGSAANSDQMKAIKAQLETWIDKHMTKYGRQNYGRTASIAYRKALLLTIVYIINYEAKLMG